MNHLALVLKDIFLSQKSGRLHWRRSGSQRFFFFQDGVLVYVKTDVPGEGLDEIFFKMGKLPQEVLEDIGKDTRTAKSLGEELLRRGLISRDDLYDALMVQAQEAVLNAFSAFDAAIEFEETPPLALKGLESRLMLPQLIAQGIRGMPYSDEVRAFFRAKIPRAKAAIFLEQLSDEERRLLAQVDGWSDPETLAANSVVSPESFWKTLFLFYCLDLIDLRSPEAAPAAEDESAVRKREQELMAELQVVREALGSLDSHQLLNVAPDATDAEIKGAYFSLARKFHPDAFSADITAEERQAVFEVFNAINNAYSVLTGRAKARAGTMVRRVFETRKPEERSEEQDRVDALFRKGQILYEEGKYGGAAAVFQDATHVDPANGDLYLWLARSESKVPALIKKSERDYLQAQRLLPDNPEPLVGLGLLYKKEGLFSLAIKQFEKASELDPYHPVAQREKVVLVNLTKKKGLLGVFKKP